MTVVEKLALETLAVTMIKSWCDGDNVFPKQ